MLKLTLLTIALICLMFSKRIWYFIVEKVAWFIKPKMSRECYFRIRTDAKLKGKVKYVLEYSANAWRWWEIGSTDSKERAKADMDQLLVSLAQ